MVRQVRHIFWFVIAAMLLAGCGSAASPQPSSMVQPPGKAPDTSPSGRSEGQNPTTSVSQTTTLSDTTTLSQVPEHTVTVAFPYIPNVQFAPYYVAASKGYYADAKLDVTFQYMYENEAVQLVAQGKAEFGFVSGISVLLARQSGMSVVTVATITHEFPVVFFSKAATPLKSVQDFKGKRIGIPGRFGACYYGLLALLYANKMQESDLNIQDIGFNQVQVLSAGNVDIACGYAMNEPVQLGEMGEQVNVLRVTDVYPLASDGIFTTQKMIESNPELVRSFVAATLRGLKDTLDQPDEAFNLSLKHIPEANLGDPAFQRKVFDATIPYWRSELLGYTDPEVWKKTHTFLVDSTLLTKAVPIEESFTNQFIK